MRTQSDLPAEPRWAVPLTAAVLILATALVYCNSFTGPFVFDDLTSISSNLSIQHLWPLSAVLSPPIGETVGGRPLVNVTLALNYAVSGTDVWSYHLLNVLIHLLAGLTLFGVLRRTLIRTTLRSDAIMLAAAAAMLWLLHPLQTEAVTYIVQRTESLASLCYLLTLYCVIRAIESPTPHRWNIVAVLVCAAGMASKEVMVSAPLLVLLYDRTFIVGTFRAALQQRRNLYLGLASTWLLLAYLVASNGRGTGAGYATGLSVGSYALTQSRAIVQYLALAVWPHSLVFDYGVPLDRSITDVAWQLALVTVLLGCTVVAIWRKPMLGFAAVAFFVLLAPSSSIVPITTQTIAEHRMYLPLATVLLLVVLGLHALFGRMALIVCSLWAVALGWTTALRNRDYQSELSLWQDTVRKQPNNPRAQYNLGARLAALGRPAEALAPLQESVRLDASYVGAHNNLGVVLAQLGRLPEADSQFVIAIGYQPELVDAHFNDAIVLLQMGHLPEAAAAYRGAVRLDPNSADLQLALGQVLVLLDQTAEATQHIEMALTINPNLAPAHNELGKILMHQGQLDAAINHFQQAIQIDPGLTEAGTNLDLARKLQQARRPGPGR